MRECGDCQLCCKLLPVKGLNKGANTRCRYQKHHKGCTVYNKTAMPIECSLWNCRWLVNDDTHDLPRPDRAHYVIDLMPDTVTAIQDGHAQVFEVIQIWVDPQYPDAHRDPRLRAYLMRQGKKGIMALIRYNDADGFTLIPPNLTGTGDWIEHPGEMYHPADRAAASAQRVAQQQAEIRAALLGK
jgi:hypothetical protein